MTCYNIYENINSNFPPLFSILRNIVPIFLFPSFKNKFDKEKKITIQMSQVVKKIRKKLCIASKEIESNTNYLCILSNLLTLN